ncbi:MAG: NAD-dependent epimerase/dehydratase family protein [Patescibacteria group bacterium]
MQTVLVAGGAGFIGSHLCDALLDLGYKVICVDNLSTSSEKNLEPLKSNPNFSFLKLNVVDPLPEDINADFVFHLASPASPNHHSPISYHVLALETMLANSTGTLELLKFAEKNSAKFLFASTSEVYGEPLVHPQKEDYRGNVSTIGPRSVYDEAKRFGETITSYFWREKNVDARIARIFNTYGPNMLREDMRMSVLFVMQALEGKPITIFGDGKQTRSLCFVTDTVDGLMKLMFTDGLKGEVVNIGSPDEHTVLEYAELIKKLCSSKSEIILSEPLPEDDPKERQPDISKAKKLLDWAPKVSLEEGFGKTIEYFKRI